MLASEIDDMVKSIMASEKLLTASANMFLQKTASVREFLRAIELEQQAPTPEPAEAPESQSPRRKRKVVSPKGLSLIECNPRARPPLMRSYDFGVVEGGGGDKPAA